MAHGRTLGRPRGEPLTLDALAELGRVSVQDAQGAISDLVQAGYLTPNEGGAVLIGNARFSMTLPTLERANG